MSDILASVSVVLGAEISGFKAAMAQARRELKGLVQFSEGLKDIGTSLTQYVSLPIAALGAASVAASGRVESLKKGLEAITLQELGKQGVTGLGALQEAAQQTTQRMSQLEQIAKQPGLGFEGAVQGDVRLRAVGISAEQSAKSIKAFANAIATTGGGKSEFDRVTVQLAQLSAKGKVLAQDLRPIIEAAPAVSGALQRLYGTVDSETISASLAKQGKSSTDFIAVLTDELAKLPQVQGGLKNAFENLADTATLSLAKIGDGISKALNIPALTAGLSNGIARLADGFASLSPGAQKVIVVLGTLAAATGPVLVAVGTLGAALPAITAGFSALGISSLAALGPLAPIAAGVAIAAALIIENWDALTAYFAPTGEGGQVFSNLAASVSESVSSISQAFGQLGGLGSDNLGGLVSATGILKALFRDIAVGITSVSDTLGGTIGAVSKLFSGNFSQAASEAKRAAFGLIDPLANLFGFTKKAQEGFEGAAQGGGLFGTSLLQASGILTGFTTQLQGFAGGLPQYGAAASALGGILEKLRAQLKEVKDQRDKQTTEKAIFADDATIKALEKEIARLEGIDKAGKKSTDAITKLRQELSRLTALDNLLGDSPSQLQVLERRADTLAKGLKTLVDAGVSTSSKAFQGFAADLVRTSQAADKLIASTSQLGGKQVAVKSLIPTTIGDTLPQDVARLLGDYAKKPIELPLKILATVPEIKFTSNPAKTISDELLTLSYNYRDAAAAAQVFGSSFDKGQADANALRTAIENLIASGINPASQKLQELGEQYQKTALMANINTAATQALQSGIAQAITGIAQYFGQLAAGTASLDDFGKTILSLLGNIVTKIGEALIAAGVGFVALQFSLNNPYGAIAAGAALVAIGAAMGSISSTLGSVGTSSAGASGGASSAVSNYGQTSNQTTIKIIAEFKIRAADLAAVGRTQDYRSRVTG